MTCVSHTCKHKCWLYVRVLYGVKGLYINSCFLDIDVRKFLLLLCIIAMFMCSDICILSCDRAKTEATKNSSVSSRKVASTSAISSSSLTKHSSHSHSHYSSQYHKDHGRSSHRSHTHHSHDRKERYERRSVLHKCTV